MREDDELGRLCASARRQHERSLQNRRWPRIQYYRRQHRRNNGRASKRVSIIEWDSVEQSQAFLNSTAYKSMAPQQEKAIRFTRAYIVEATQ
jgi:hypothetical protein